MSLKARLNQSVGNTLSILLAGPEGPPRRPEGATCPHCGQRVSRSDQERGKCPHCGGKI